MSTPQAPDDERRLVRALTAVLQQRRHDLVQGGGDGSTPATPIWQPLIDALGSHAMRRRTSAADAAADTELAAEVAVLRDEARALEHALTVWSAALAHAIEQSARRPAEPVYARQPGPNDAAAPRQTLGRC